MTVYLDYERVDEEIARSIHDEEVNFMRERAFASHELRVSCGPFGTRCGENHSPVALCPTCREALETWCICPENESTDWRDAIAPEFRTSSMI